MSTPSTAVASLVKTIASAFTLISVLQPAHASESSLDSNSESEWLVLVSPFAWAPSMKGHVELGGVHTKADLSANEILHNLDSVFMGNVEVTNRTVGFFIDGVHAKTSQSDRVFGRKVGLEITQTTFAEIGRASCRERV